MRTSHKLWVDYPAFLSLPPNAAPEGPSKRSTLPPTPKLPPPVVGAMGAAEAALDAATATLAMVVAVAQVVVVVSTSGAPVQVLALRNNKGCYVFLRSTCDPAWTLCTES